MRIGIIGGGVTGMAEAFYLARKGHDVTLYEKGKTLGGLAAWFNIGGRDVERYYHFIMTCDKHQLDWYDELGLTNELNWVGTQTAFYTNAKFYPFSEPMHLLKFAPLSIPQRLRLAATLAYMTKVSKNWRAYEDRKACEWLPKYGGRKAWELIFKPMLDMKFGSHRDEMSMAWLWGRFNMVGQYREEKSGKEKRAWLKGSTRVLVEACERELAKLKVTVRKEANVEQIVVENGRAAAVIEGGERRDFDRIVFSAPSTTLKALLPASTEGDAYFKTIYDQKYYGVTCLVASLTKKINPYFWTYISDANIPFVGLVNYADFTAWEGQPGHNVIYIPWYSEVHQEPYTLPKEVVIARYMEGLKKMHPGFDESWVQEVIVARDPSTAMVCTGRYSERLIGLKTPIKDLYFANLSQIYPQDRGISPGIKLARYAVKAVETDTDVPMDFSPKTATEEVPI